MHRYRVTVMVEGRQPFTCTVRAPREGLAKTEAMMVYLRQTPNRLRGEFVDYDVKLA